MLDNEVYCIVTCTHCVVPYRWFLEGLPVTFCDGTPGFPRFGEAPFSSVDAPAIETSDEMRRLFDVARNALQEYVHELRAGHLHTAVIKRDSFLNLLFELWEAASTGEKLEQVQRLHNGFNAIRAHLAVTPDVL